MIKTVLFVLTVTPEWVIVLQDCHYNIQYSDCIQILPPDMELGRNHNIDVCRAVEL